MVVRLSELYSRIAKYKVGLGRDATAKMAPLPLTGLQETPRCVTSSSSSEEQVLSLMILVVPYCTIPRDYLSDTPLLHAMGFWCLNMANWERWERYPLPLF